MARTLALPLRTHGAALATLEQGSSDEISQSVALLLATRPGERRTVPGYGLPDPLFGNDLDADVIAGVIAEWEDRADDVAVAQAVTDLARGVIAVSVSATSPVLPVASGTAAGVPIAIALAGATPGGYPSSYPSNYP